MRGYVIEDMMTTTQWGAAFEVKEVKLIKLGQTDLGKTL